MQRNQKTVSLIYLACGFISWLLFREIVGVIWIVAGIPNPLDWIVTPPDMISACMGIVTFIILMRNPKVGEFTNEVITELGKAVWPQRKETALSTGVVSILVGICAAIFFVFDMLWGTVVKIFYR